MSCQEIITKLQELSDEKYKNNIVKLGIPADCCIGVSTGEVRGLAKTIGKSNALAHELWDTGYHEAKLLAVLLFDKKKTSLEEAAILMSDVVSWDLCDHLCKNLLLKLPDYDSLIDLWIVSPETYKKRAAFTLMASAVIHKKDISNETLDSYLRLIAENASDEREHVKKAVSWALREIGKKNFDYNEKAILLAHELKESGDKVRLWIAKDVLKELESIVKVQGRERLISSDSKMGKEN